MDNYGFDDDYGFDDEYGGLNDEPEFTGFDDYEPPQMEEQEFGQEFAAFDRAILDLYEGLDKKIPVERFLGVLISIGLSLNKFISKETLIKLIKNERLLKLYRLEFKNPYFLMQGFLTYLEGRVIGVMDLSNNQIREIIDQTISQTEGILNVSGNIEDIFRYYKFVKNELF